MSAIAQRFLAEIEEPQLREAVRAASVVRRVTRSLLRALMPSLRDDLLFERLAGLPFVESAHDGLIIHDAVREAIRTDLEAIDPPTCQRYRRAAWQQLNHEAKSAGLGNLWRYSADLIFLINNPSIREAFFPKDVARFYVERAGAGDGAAILSIAAEHEGREAALIMEGWWKHLPTSFSVIRDAGGQIAGFYCLLDPADAAPSMVRRDPLTSAWAGHLLQRPLSRGKTALFVRRWLSRQQGESPSPVQAAAWLDIKRHYLERRPRLQRVYLALAERHALRGSCFRPRYPDHGRARGEHRRCELPEPLARHGRAVGGRMAHAFGGGRAWQRAGRPARRAPQGPGSRVAAQPF